MPVNTPQVLLSLFEGLGLAFSPCILPILPFILASTTSNNRLRPFLIIGGFIISFTIFSLISRQILAWTGLQQDTIQRGAYSLLLVFGLILLIPQLEEHFAKVTNKLADNANSLSTGKFADSTIGGLMVGALIGLVWTPCAGPILAAAIVQVIQAQTTIEASATIAAFAIGSGIPMLLIALFGQYLTVHIRNLNKHASSIRRVMGALIVGFAAMALSGVNIAQYVTPQSAGGPILGRELENKLEQPYDAPEISGITQWFNSQPLDLPSLKGKVVLIDFWTYSCINCIRTLPHIESLYEKYKDNGLVVIGVHSPEFAFEGNPKNVADAIDKFRLTYPVAMDNSFTTWNNFKNRYWPAQYLIDQNGRVVYTHFGEGGESVTENNIRFLLHLGQGSAAETASASSADSQTPETYLGLARAERESSQDTPDLNQWHLAGKWDRKSQYLESTAAGDAITLHYRAKKVFLVMESADSSAHTVTVTPDTNTPDVQNGQISVQSSRLYQIIQNDTSKDDRVMIKADQPGLRLYAFTFGN